MIEKVRLFCKVLAVFSLAALLGGFAVQGQEESGAGEVKDEVVSRVLNENDALGRTLRMVFLDKDMKPVDHGMLSPFLEKVTLKAQGFSAIRFSYKTESPDEIPAIWEFEDGEGKLALTSQGYSRIEVDSSGEGRVYECRYMGLDGALTDTREGFAVIKRTFEGTGNLVEEAFYNKDGQLALNKSLGYAATKINYIKNDREEYEEHSFLDPQGNPLKVDGAFKHVQGIAKGDDPMTIIKSYNNLDDSLMNGPRGYALHVRRELDTRKNPEEAYLDEKSELVDGPDGYAQLFYYKDDKTGEEKIEYMNAKGEIVKNPSLKWDSKVFKRNDKGEETKAAYFKADGSSLENQNKKE